MPRQSDQLCRRLRSRSPGGWNVPLEADSTPAGTVTFPQTPAFMMMRVSPGRVSARQIRAAAVGMSCTIPVRVLASFRTAESAVLVASQQVANGVRLVSRTPQRPCGKNKTKQTHPKTSITLYTERVDHRLKPCFTCTQTKPRPRPKELAILSLGSNR